MDLGVDVIPHHFTFTCLDGGERSELGNRREEKLEKHVNVEKQKKREAISHRERDKLRDTARQAARQTDRQTDLLTDGP